MASGDCKVYNNGSHYIAMPYRPNNKRRRKKPSDEIITVVDTPCEEVLEQESDKDNLNATDTKHKPVKVRTVTRKEYFEELYEETKNLKKKERHRVILEKMLPHFTNERDAEVYV